MTKSNPVDETRIADPVELANRQPRANAKKGRRTAKAQKRRTRTKGAIGRENTGKFAGFGLEIAKAPRLSEENSIAY
jgi:hypothetical protein